MSIPKRALAGALALCLLLGGCAVSDDTPARQPEEPAPVEQPDETVQTAPDEVRYAMPCAAGESWDPYTCQAQENRTIFALLYEGLFELTPEFTAEGVLCGAYTVSDDEKTWTFTLADDACFSDGSALTANDVVRAYALAQESELYASRFTHIARYEATGTRTLTVTLDTAMGDLPLLLDIPVVRVTASGSIVGSGSYVRSGSKLRASERWWQEREVPLGGAEVTLVETDGASAVRDAFELREVTLVCADPTAGNACVYHSDYELWTAPTSVMIYLGFNRQSSLFSDASVRAGVTKLIDRETIATEDFDGFALAASLPASPLSGRYDRSLAAQYAYDPDDFSAEVPQTEGILLVNAGDRCRVAAAGRIADALAEKGFSLTVRALPSEDYQAALRAGAYDCYLGEIRLSADFSLEAFLRPTGSAAYGIGGSEVGLLLNTKMLENVGNAYDLHRQIMDDGVLCPILFKSCAVYTVRGVVTDGLTAAPYNVFYRTK